MEFYKKNKNNSSIYSLLTRLFYLFKKKRRVQFYLLICLSAVTSILEVICLALIIPFVSVITQPDKINNNILLNEFLNLLGIQKTPDIALFLTIIFSSFVLLTAFFRLLLIFVYTRLSNIVSAELSVSMYEIALYRPYMDHINSNSSKIITLLIKNIMQVYVTLSSTVVIITSLVIFIVLAAALFWIHPVIILIFICFFGALYYLINLFFRNIVINNSKIINKEQNKEVRTVQEGLGAIRDILLDGTQEVYVKLFKTSAINKSYKIAESALIQQSPRFFLEALGLILMATLLFVISKRPEGINSELGVLSALALGAQRLIPLMNSLYTNYAYANSGKTEFEQVVLFFEKNKNIKKEIFPLDKIKFEDSIQLKKISFSYNKNVPLVLKNVDVKIKKGSRIGIIGMTGGGKSTFVDILMGLIKPNKGKLLIDGITIDEKNIKSWQYNIAHVPQSIYLSDASIAENIAFGIPFEDINLEDVKFFAEKAKIAKFIENRPNRYKEIIGERGIRLSGGQRQRIGIARALYKRADLIIFDEATNALDSTTEDSVMNSIYGLDKNLTIIIIAHRITTLEKCDKIFKVENGTIKIVSKR
jgi:ATP-binding cassette subfamily B protein